MTVGTLQVPDVPDFSVNVHLPNKKKRRRLKAMHRILKLLAGPLLTVSLSLLTPAGPAPASAQEYPTRPITLIVPWPAGGLNDVVLRVIAEQAAKTLGQPILIDNRAGGGGSVGPATMAATAKPDGYTFAQMPDATYRIPLMQKSPWDPEKDFTYIIGLYAYAFGLIVPADSPFKTWKEVVEYAKANPGKLTFGTPGAASSLHMGMEKLIRASGIKLTHVPFKGSLEENTAIAGGHVNMGASGSSAKPLADGGKIRFIQMWTRTRTKNLPDVPTLREDGYPFEVESPVGLAGPKGMDPKIVAKIHDAFKQALDTPEARDVLAKFDMTASYKSSDDYKAFISDAIKGEREILESIGLARKD
jgi:tripartite-type tricarboxylate transporter receptor subunit TctC